MLENYIEGHAKRGYKLVIGNAGITFTRKEMGYVATICALREDGKNQDLHVTRDQLQNLKELIEVFLDRHDELIGGK